MLLDTTKLNHELFWKEYPDFYAKQQFPTYEFYKFHKEIWHYVIAYLNNF